MTPMVHTRNSSRSLRHASLEDSESKQNFLASLTLPLEDPIPVGNGNLTSLFVTFDKRGAVIRLSDAAVQEIKLSDDPPCLVHRRHSNKRESLDGAASTGWLPIITMHLPNVHPHNSQPELDHSRFNQLKTVCILTKGTRTHIIRSPIPNPMSTTSPLIELRWTKQPTGISARICQPPIGTPHHGVDAVLQIVGFGRDGIEVIEVGVASLKGQAIRLKRGSTLSPAKTDEFDLGGGPSMGTLSIAIPSSSPSTLEPPYMATGPRSRPSSPNPNYQPYPHHSPDKGKGKEKSLPPVPPGRSDSLDVEITRGYLDIAADASLLCRGGLWHDVMDTGRRMEPPRGIGGFDSDVSPEEDEWAKRERERDACGIYGSAMRMTGDYRVFYVGDYVEGDVVDDTAD